MIFAFRVFGRSRTKCTSRGASGFPSAWEMLDRNASPSARPVRVGFSTQKQTSASPFISSGTR